MKLTRSGSTCYSLDVSPTGGVVATMPLGIKPGAYLRENRKDVADREDVERYHVLLALEEARIPEGPWVVRLTRLHATRALDPTRLESVFLGVRRAVARRLGVDPIDPRVRWRYAQEKGLQYGVSIEIERNTEADHVVQLEPNRARLLILFACRYALGRDSFAPVEVMETLRAHADVMRVEDLLGLADDMDDEIRRDQCPFPLPHVRAWEETAAWCRAEAARRNERNT